MAGVGEAYCADVPSCIPKLLPAIQHIIRSIHRGANSVTNASRVTMIRLLAFVVLVLATTSRAQTRPPIAEQLAKTYGLDSFGQIEAIRYTFNLQIPVFKLDLSRTWTWEPKTGQVTYEGKDKDGKPVKITYVRSQVNSAPANVQDKGMQKLPLGKGSARLVSVKYPAEVGGYTPGDTWDLYVGKDERVVQFVYHRGGPKKPSNVTTTWAGYKKGGPLLISTDHRGTADGKPARIFFSNVSVKLAGSSTWMNAQ